MYKKCFTCYGNDIYVYTIDNKRFQVKQQLLMFAYVYLFNTQFLHINIKQGEKYNYMIRTFNKLITILGKILPTFGDSYSHLEYKARVKLFHSWPI